jgi:hypothetical protein
MGLLGAATCRHGLRHQEEIIICKKSGDARFPNARFAASHLLSFLMRFIADAVRWLQS